MINIEGYWEIIFNIYFFMVILKDIRKFFLIYIFLWLVLKDIGKLIFYFEN